MKILEGRAKFMMVLEYEIHKEHGSSRWYVTAVGSKQPIPGDLRHKDQSIAYGSRNEQCRLQALYEDEKEGR